MISISLCMIVKNEEDVLDRCLNSVKDIVDEIIIVDTGSTDRTKEIAERFTDKIYDFKWVDNFSKARNFAFSKATKDYQMWLDADDIILEEDKNKIKSLKDELPSNVDIVTMKYNTHFDENNIPIFTSTRGRLFKRNKNYEWKDHIHEYIELKGNIYYAMDIYITHKKEAYYTDRNLKIYQKQIEEGVELSPRSLYYFARELKDHKRYNESIKYFEKFLEGNKGWIEDNIASCFNLGICYKSIGDNKRSMEALLKSFIYDIPRAEICCELGYHFKAENNINKAVYWFLLATTLIKPNTIGFILNDYWGYVPNIELSVCYYKLNDLEKAMHHNKIAKEYKPQSKAVAHNELFYKSIKS